MAGKYGLYLPYNLWDILMKVKISDTKRIEYLKAIFNYEREGKEPDLKSNEFQILFSTIKPGIDDRKQRYEARCRINRENAKSGGAPKGNRNAAGNRGGGAPSGNRNAQNTTETTQSVKFEKQTQPKQPKQPDIDLDQDIDIDHDGSSVVVFETQPPQTTTTIILNLLKECKKAGFTLDRKITGKILNTGIDPSWLAGPFSFPEYAAQYIREEYPDKPPGELRRLFIKSFNWEDLREEYPAWREQQEAAAALREEELRREAARANIPRMCSNCGKPLVPDCQECPSCNWQYKFDDEGQKYLFYPPINLKESFEAFMMRSGP